MLKEVKSEIAKTIADVAQISEAQALAAFEIPKEGFGDMASKIAFMLASGQKRNPVEIAGDIAEKLKTKKIKFIEKIETKGPYINFYFSNEFYIEALKKILKEKEKFGKAKKTKNKIMVEFFHANTHKGVHIGHIRNIVLGEALCRVLEADGNNVIRAN